MKTANHTRAERELCALRAELREADGKQRKCYAHAARRADKRKRNGG